MASHRKVGATSIPLIRTSITLSGWALAVTGMVDGCRSRATDENIIIVKTMVLERLSSGLYLWNAVEVMVDTAKQ